MNRLIQILIGAVATIVLFGAGLLIGRQFPAHHYERFGQSPYLYDTATGKMCTTVKQGNPVDDLFSKSSEPKTSANNLLDEGLKNPPEYPLCGK
jgi:hypothetical protein